MDRKLKSHRHSNLDKAVIALFSSACAAFLGIALVCLIDWWEWKDAGPAYETSLITNILGTTFIVGLYMVLVAIVGALTHSYKSIGKRWPKALQMRANIDGTRQP